eukprot:CAMPEP_0176283996 /NCGR_PEP_ID=MMETSP0121_2-20121125/51612_1 /TAXON_ID=160619 /ORGANISM="Kryptoperidinium foliaceum, Strain CCMP 1326" /LENGTH=70 /DNA_ID=CAMNT_0017624407 /DNA_START=61 /DNA_END=269 /DNA_ORIENTATION=-
MALSFGERQAKSEKIPWRAPAHKSAPDELSKLTLARASGGKGLDQARHVQTVTRFNGRDPRATITTNASR